MGASGDTKWKAVKGLKYLKILKMEKGHCFLVCSELRLHGCADLCRGASTRCVRSSHADLCRGASTHCARSSQMTLGILFYSTLRSLNIKKDV